MKNCPETFTQMVARLIDVHGWSRKLAIIATRYYLGVEGMDDLQARTQPQPVVEGYWNRPDLSLSEAHEIIRYR